MNVSVNVKKVCQDSDSLNVRCCRCGCTIYDLSKVHRINVSDSCQNSGATSSITMCPKCADKLSKELNAHIQEFVGLDEFEQACNLILSGLAKMGMNIDPENFKDTPKRFARAYYSIFEGCVDTDNKVASILSTSFPSDGRSDMIVAKDIVCFSMCPHHILPVEYHVCVGYIPSKDGKVLGISKLARLVSTLAARPMLQETFTHEIVDSLNSIGVQGAVALVEGRHMCMRMRGAQARESSITTTALSGILEHDTGAKEEFMKTIESRARF